MFIFAFPIPELKTIFVGMALPIVMAAFLIGPIYSYVHWLIIGFIYTLRLYSENALNPEDFFFVGLISLLVIAVVSWLIARSLDKALAETKALNEELDQRVQDRTRELAEALEREHETAVRNTTILESIADGVLFFDADQQVKIANPTVNRLANRDLRSLTLTEILTTIEEKARGVIKSWVEGQKSTDESNVKFEWQQRTISATVAPVLLPTAEGESINAGNVMVLRDFTKEAQLERVKSLFLGMVSHELRTPMSAIKGYVKILLDTEKDNLSEAAYEHLQTIDSSIKQLLSLANELIDLSRLETGEIELYREWVDLSPIIKQAVKIVQQEFTARNLELEIKLEDNLPKLYLDKSRILQILLNLLSNAYKYTAQGGATIQVNQFDERITIAVSDTGVGIKPADHANIFGRFFRAGDQFVQQAGGTGLGLNISKGLVELHGGKLNFTSQYGVGTTFWLDLPKNGQAVVEDKLEAVQSL
jgi:signal transduction histidine kinase